MAKRASKRFKRENQRSKQENQSSDQSVYTFKLDGGKEVKSNDPNVIPVKGPKKVFKMLNFDCDENDSANINFLNNELEGRKKVKKRFYVSKNSNGTIKYIYTLEVKQGKKDVFLFYFDRIKGTKVFVQMDGIYATISDDNYDELKKKHPENLEKYVEALEAGNSMQTSSFAFKAEVKSKNDDRLFCTIPPFSISKDEHFYIFNTFKLKH